MLYARVYQKSAVIKDCFELIIIMRVVSFDINNISTYKIGIWVVSSYFFVFAISTGLMPMMGFAGAGAITKLYFLIVCVIASQYVLTEGKILDWLFILFTFTVAIASILQTYETDLFIDGISTIPSMYFFLIGRSQKIKVSNIINRGLSVYLIVAIIGLYLFFTMPSWYLNWKLNDNVKTLTDNVILEMTRLSAFWPYPYWVSYGGMIIYTFVVCNMLKKNTYTYVDVSMLGLIFVVLILAQQRTPIYCISLTTIFFVLYRTIQNKSLKELTTVILFLIIVLYLLVNFVADDFLTRALFKYEQSTNDSFLRERSEIFSYFLDRDYSFWGDGIGRYSHGAYFKYGRKAITDQNYLKILYENGLFGIIGYSFFILYSLFRGLKNFKHKFFELSIVVFYLIGMFGANCISNIQQHALIFWLCCGQLTINNK